MACASKLECTLLMKQLVKQLAIPLSNQRTVAKWLVIAIPLGHQNTLAKWLVNRRSHEQKNRSSDIGNLAARRLRRTAAPQGCDARHARCRRLPRRGWTGCGYPR